MTAFRIDNNTFEYELDELTYRGTYEYSPPKEEVVGGPVDAYQPRQGGLVIESLHVVLPGNDGIGIAFEVTDRMERLHMYDLIRDRILQALRA